MDYLNINEVIEKIREKQINNIVFDFDGTLINSEPYHYEIHKHIMKKLAGYDLTKEDYLKNVMGHSNEETYEQFLKTHKLNVNIEDVVSEKVVTTNVLLMKKHVKFFDYFFELKKQLKNVDFYIISNNNAYIIKVMLYINKCTPEIKHIYSLPDLKQNKEQFLKDLEKNVGIPKNSTVIFEDSNSKLKLAKSCNYALTVGVESEFNTGKLVDCDYILKVD